VGRTLDEVEGYAGLAVGILVLVGAGISLDKELGSTFER
jgi:hypothetical protein